MNLSRTTLVPGDPLRDFTIAWSRDGLSGSFTLDPVDGSPSLFLQDKPVGANSQHSEGFAGAPLVAVGTPPGAYTLNNEGDLAAVTVVARPNRPAIRLNPGTLCLSAGCVQRMLDTGHDLILDPGTYYFDRAIRLPPGCTIRGHGARLVRLPDGDYGERMFIGGQDCTLEGLGLVPIWLAFHAPDVTTGLVLKDCTVFAGNFGYAYAEAYFENCLFDGGTMVVGAPHGHYRRCRWTRNPPDTNAFAVSGPCVGALVLEDCTFDDTDRGPVSRCLQGPVADNLIVGLRLRDIQRDQNGNEMVSAEGNGLHGFDRNLVIGTRVRNCDGNFFLPWDAPARGNLVLDTVVRGGGGLWLGGVNDAEQSGNVYDQFELHDTDGIRLGWRDGHGRAHGLGIAGNVIRNGAVLGFRPSRMNQGRYAAATYERAGWFDKVACGAGNRFENVSYRVNGINATLTQDIEATASVE